MEWMSDFKKIKLLVLAVTNNPADSKLTERPVTTSQLLASN